MSTSTLKLRVPDECRVVDVSTGETLLVFSATYASKPSEAVLVLQRPILLGEPRLAGVVRDRAKFERLNLGLAMSLGEGQFRQTYGVQLTCEVVGPELESSQSLILGSGPPMDVLTLPVLTVRLWEPPAEIWDAEPVLR